MILSFCSLDKEFWLLVVIDDEAIDGSPEIDDAFEDAALQTPESRLAAWQLTWRFDLMPLAKSFLPALLVLLSWCPLAHAERRIALVVGNSGYQHARLANPSNDAQLMADTLKSLGFTLVGDGAQIDLDKGKLDAAVQSFGKLLQSADVALFYFAGHGVQVSNYLVPVNANVAREADVGFQMLDINLVLQQMHGAGTRLNVIILDACRNNPFVGRGLRAAEGGLAQMRAPEGTLISYATQPGSVAQDGDNGNSPYTRALAETLKRPGLGLFDVFNEVGLAVQRTTGGAQQPWVSASPIAGSFYFASPQSLPRRHLPHSRNSPLLRQRHRHKQPRSRRASMEAG
jgi:hypothetical protein